MASEQFSSGLELQLMTPGTISSGLIQNLNTLCSTNQERLGYLLPTMFDEFFQPPSVVYCAPAAAVTPIPIDATDTPSSTLVDQDEPSVSTSPTTEDTQAPVLHQDVEGQQALNAQFDIDPFANIFNLDPSSKESSSRDVIVSDLHSTNQPFERLSKWTRNHPLDNVIGNPSRPVSTRSTNGISSGHIPETLKRLSGERKSNGGNSSCIIGLIVYIRDLVDFGVTIYIISILKKALYLLKKGLLARGEAKKASKRRMMRLTTDCCFGQSDDVGHSRFYSHHGPSDAMHNPSQPFKYGESSASALEDPTLRAGNLVKEILLKLNLLGHRHQVIKVKYYLGRLLASFQEIIKYEHAGPKTQDRKKVKYYKMNK
ncbi:hypothetical protein Tco_0241610 [Tanacetum coccineum]